MTDHADCKLKVFLLTSFFISALLQLNPDIIVAKILKSTSPGQVVCETTSPHPGSTTTQDIGAAVPRYNEAWLLGNLLGTFRYRRIRYKVFKWRDRGDARSLQEKDEIQAEYYWPSWLINRVWKIQAVKASTGWTFIPRTYNNIPEDSDVIRYARTNNVIGLQELFSMKRASPFDCTSDARTPLTVSFLYFVVQEARKLTVSGRCSAW